LFAVDCFLPGQIKDLSAPTRVLWEEKKGLKLGEELGYCMDQVSQTKKNLTKVDFPLFFYSIKLQV
jgi:hypothetical protein